MNEEPAYSLFSLRKEESPQRRLLILAYLINKELEVVGKIETGSYFQGCNHVGEIELLVSNDKGVWEVNIRPSFIGNFITIIDSILALDTGSGRKKILGIFRELGYVYTSHDVLMQS